MFTLTGIPRQLSYRVARITLTSLLLAVATTSFAQPGVRKINPPQPVNERGIVEVLEFFAYGCGACAAIDGPFDEWVKMQPKDVKIRRIPSPAPIAGVDTATLYYTLEAMGQLKRLHEAIFNAIHVEKQMLGHGPTLMKWLEKNGVDPARYNLMRTSFSALTKINTAARMSEDYRITSTPTFVVQGRVAISPMGKGTTELFGRLDKAIAEARAAATKR